MKALIRKGFTLAELLIAVLIFGFMITSLATIYSTANKHVFQNYRQNTIKSEALAAMKDIANSLMTANRIDSPASGAAGNVLAFAVNVDHDSGCRISAAASAPAWHYFCLNGRTLFHHTGTVSPVPPDCSLFTLPCGTCWPTVPSPASYPVLACGGPYGTVTQLSSLVSPPPGPGALFSRRNSDGVYEGDQVKVMVRVFWDPADPLKVASGIDLRTSARVIDSTLTTTVKVNRSVNGIN